ncbi:MAG: hypothetical protein Q7S88_03375 [Candidatus Daviesbacteria bacterium]|nr:hypothetical protein [Candidatus Daviesbacteria bacterium]
MEYLPLELVDDLEKQRVSESIFNLSKLLGGKFPVTPSLVIFPPDRIDKNPDLLKKIPVLKLWKNFYLNGFSFKSLDELWREMVLIWDQDLKSNRDLRPIFISKQITKSLEATGFVDQNTGKIIVEVLGNGELDEQKLKDIQAIILKANKYLFLPQVYTFQIGDEILISQLKPYTGVHHTSLPIEVTKHDSLKAFKKRAVKILSTSYSVIPEVDGYYLEGVDTLNFDSEILKIRALVKEDPTKVIIYKIAEPTKTQIIYAASVINFLRHKDQLLNVEVSVPACVTVGEFTAIKRELASLGVHRKGTLNLWLEIKSIENILKIENYLEAGVDGVVMRIDLLHQLFYGYSELSYTDYKHLFEEFMPIVSDFLKKAHKKSIPVVVRGKLLANPHILHQVLDKGVWGLIFEENLILEYELDYLSWVEKRVVLKRNE